MQRDDSIDFQMPGVDNLRRMKNQTVEEIAVSGIGEKYGAFRIVRPAADAAMMQSIQRYGQISPVVCVEAEGGYELIDGFKRLRAFRRLNKPSLKTKMMDFSERACKAAIIQLNRSGRSINGMEEAMVVQSLHREDRLTQMEIAALLGRHKSWVSRRISLIERLSEEVQEHIKLGLLSVIAGWELAKLQRCNQKAAADAVLKHRLSTRETSKLITYLLSRPRWEHQAVLSAPWGIIEPKQPRPVGLEAKLLSFERICQSLSEGVKKSGIENTSYLRRVIGAAEELVKTLRAAL